MTHCAQGMASLGIHCQWEGLSRAVWKHKQEFEQLAGFLALHRLNLSFSLMSHKVQVFTCLHNGHHFAPWTVPWSRNLKLIVEALLDLSRILAPTKITHITVLSNSSTSNPSHITVSTNQKSVDTLDSWTCTIRFHYITKEIGTCYSKALDKGGAMEAFTHNHMLNIIKTRNDEGSLPDNIPW